MSLSFAKINKANDQKWIILIFPSFIYQWIQNGCPILGWCGKKTGEYIEPMAGNNKNAGIGTKDPAKHCGDWNNCLNLMEMILKLIFWWEKYLQN